MRELVEDFHLPPPPPSELFEKTDTMGMLRLRGWQMFIENPGRGEHSVSEENVYYTIKDRDHYWKGKKRFSLKRIYLNYADVKEYNFACDYFYSYKHWLETIKKNKSFAKIVEEWREELLLKIQSDGLRNIIDKASSGDFHSNKYILEEGWKKNRVGRPTKKEFADNTKRDESLEIMYAEDLKRLRVTGAKRVQ